MTRHRRPLLLAAAAAGAVISLVAGPTGVASATDPAPALAPAAGSPSPVHLAHAVRGAGAVRALGPQLAAVAQLNKLSPAALRSALRSDHTLVVGTDGHIMVEDQLPAPKHVAPLAQQVAGFTPVEPLEDTFDLHSLPDSTHKLYLDFVGGTVTGTVWNDPAQAGNGFFIAPSIAVPPWNVDHDQTTFSDAERTAIQEIWSRVAEDYAPFDIDVTTADPGVDGLDRTGDLDDSYGMEVMFSATSNTWCNCSGVSQISAFDETGDHMYRTPAWVYTSSEDNDVAWMAEAAAHEAGHTLGLFHDGDVNPDGTIGQYDLGHGVWAPIMGDSRYEAVTQWSLGEYAGADNQQDDRAVIASHSGGAMRADETGSSPATALALPDDLPADATTGVIGSRTDTDVYDLGQCTGTVSLSADGAQSGGDLDIKLDLLDAGGNVIASNDPPVSQIENGTDQPIATGLNAAIDQDVTAGEYYARVDGVGDTYHNDDPTISYDDYGSLGHYTLAATGCTTGTSAPAAPLLLSAGTYDNGSVPLRWTPPAIDGNTPLTGYQLSVDSGPAIALGPDTTTYTAGDLSAGPHTFSLTALNADGTSTPTTTAIGAPDAPEQVQAVVGFDAASRQQSVTVTWLQQRWAVPPGGAEAFPGDGYRVNGAPILGYHVYDAGGVLIATEPAGTWSTDAVALAPGEQFSASVAAYNALGESPQVSVSVVGKAGPQAVSGATASVDAADQQVTIHVKAPASPDSPLTSLRVRKDASAYWSSLPLVADASHVYDYTFVNMAPGTHTIDLMASNQYADSPVTTLHVTVKAPAPKVTRPGAPARPRVQAGPRGGKVTATVTWKNPTKTGGATITHVKLTIYRLNTRGKVAQRTTRTLGGSVHRFTAGLRPNTRYRFAVQAQNSAGWSPLSPQSSKIVGR